MGINSSIRMFLPYAYSLSWYYVLFSLFYYGFFLVFITLTAKIVDTHAFQWSMYILFWRKNPYEYNKYVVVPFTILSIAISHFVHFQWKMLGYRPIQVCVVHGDGDGGDDDDVVVDDVCYCWV